MIVRKPFILEPGEILKPVVGYEGLYEVSNFGKVKCLEDDTEVDYYVHQGSGYIRCSIKGKYYRVHRLVAQAFIPNPDNLPEVDHIDGNKNNNKVSNLRWVSHKKNMENHFENHEAGFQKAKPVRCVETQIVYSSVREASREVEYIDKKTGERRKGINKNRIQETLHGGQKTAAGYHWEYVEE